MSLTHTVPNDSLDVWLYCRSHGVYLPCLLRTGDEFCKNEGIYFCGLQSDRCKTKKKGENGQNKSREAVSLKEGFEKMYV